VNIYELRISWVRIKKSSFCSQNWWRAGLFNSTVETG